MSLYTISPLFCLLILYTLERRRNQTHQDCPLWLLHYSFDSKLIFLSSPHPSVPLLLLSVRLIYYIFVLGSFIDRNDLLLFPVVPTLPSLVFPIYDALLSSIENLEHPVLFLKVKKDLHYPHHLTHPPRKPLKIHFSTIVNKNIKTSPRRQTTSFLTDITPVLILILTTQPTTHETLYNHWVCFTVPAFSPFSPPKTYSKCQ